jgi:hypothetical protein
MTIEPLTSQFHRLIWVSSLKSGVYSVLLITSNCLDVYYQALDKRKKAAKETLSASCGALRYE